MDKTQAEAEALARMIGSVIDRSLAGEIKDVEVVRDEVRFSYAGRPWQALVLPR